MDKQTQKTILINPFSVSLKKHPFMEVNSKPIYENGNYRIYHYSAEHFVHTFKNIVIGERGAANRALLDGLKADIKPKGEAALYHDYERPKAAIVKGRQAAKTLNFQIK